MKKCSKSSCPTCRSPHVSAARGVLALGNLVDGCGPEVSMLLPAPLNPNMDATTTRTLWANAEREACALLDSRGNASELLELARCLDDSPNAGLSGYSQLWLGFFGAEEDAFSRASSLWQSVADNVRSDAQDRAWWLHCAVVAELLRPCPVSGPTPDLLSRTLVALGAVDRQPSLTGDLTARQTFSLLRSEFCFLAGEIEPARQLVEDLRSAAVPFKKSLATELKGAALSVSQEQAAAAAAAFQEAARLHSLFIHKARCMALAQHLVSGGA